MTRSVRLKPKTINQLILRVLAIPLILYIIIPLIALITQVPFDEFVDIVNGGQVMQAVTLSLVTCTISTIITILAGTPLAYSLSRKRTRLATVIDTIIDLPTVLPPAVAGVALLIAFGRRGLIGSYLAEAGLAIPFTQIAVIMAQTFVASPFYVKAAVIGFSNVNRELLEAASLDGANSWQSFQAITLPLAGFSILSGAVMTWARALGEFGATIIFAGNFPGRTQTMPLAIYVGFELELKTALTLSLILICFSFFTLISVKTLLNRFVELEQTGTE